MTQKRIARTFNHARTAQSRSSSATVKPRQETGLPISQFHLYAAETPIFTNTSPKPLQTIDSGGVATDEQLFMALRGIVGDLVARGLCRKMVTQSGDPLIWFDGTTVNTKLELIK